MSLITNILPINKADDIGQLSHADLNLHDCLTDDADWNNDYWDFHPECIGNFTEVIKSTYQSSTKGIIFQAIWASDSPEITIELPIDEMLNTLISNKVSTRAKYIVIKNA